MPGVTSLRATPLRLLLAAVVLVGGAGTAAAVLQQRDDAPPAVAAPQPDPVPSRAPLLPAAADAPVPSAAGLDAVVAAALADPALGGQVAAAVVDVRTGEVLLDRRGATPVTPASTAKIATAVAALHALDPLARPVTRVLAGAAPGEVVLVGAGDATLARTAGDPAGYPERATLEALAAATRAALGAAPLTRVLVDDTAWSGPATGPGWTPGYVTGGDVAPVSALAVDAGRPPVGRAPRAADTALQAGQLLAERLGAPAAPVARGTAPPGAAELARVTGPTVAQQVEVLLTRSDNDVGESLARQVAVARGQAPTFAGAEAAVGQALAEVVPGGGFALRDGSGLSRESRLQPVALARLLAEVAGDPGQYAPVLAGLPVAGFDGTLAERYDDPLTAPAAGVVRGKTGTLNGVSALAGLLRTADGRLLAFDLTADAVPLGANRAAEGALDRLATALASCGCR